MTRLRSVVGYAFLGTMLCACAVPRAPSDPPVPSAEEFPGEVDKLIGHLSQVGANLHSVEGRRIFLAVPNGDDDACPRPPRPHFTASGVDPASLKLAFAAAMLVNEDKAAGRTTTVIKCRPVGD